VGGGGSDPFPLYTFASAKIFCNIKLTIIFLSAVYFLLGHPVSLSPPRERGGGSFIWGGSTQRLKPLPVNILIFTEIAPLPYT